MVSPAAFDVAEGIAILTCTPAVLDAWLRDLPEPWIRADEGPDTRSPFDIVGHLIDGEETDWIPRAHHPGAGGRAALLATWVAHDLDHLMQIARIMGKRYIQAAGPWQVYLRDLRS